MTVRLRGDSAITQQCMEKRENELMQHHKSQHKPSGFRSPGEGPAMCSESSEVILIQTDKQFGTIGHFPLSQPFCVFCFLMKDFARVPKGNGASDLNHLKTDF